MSLDSKDIIDGLKEAREAMTLIKQLKGSLVGVEYETEQDAINGILSGLGEGFEIIKIEEM